MEGCNGPKTGILSTDKPPARLMGIECPSFMLLPYYHVMQLEHPEA
jgi:hypothetical protein